jgi:hypothetical protein
MKINWTDFSKEKPDSDGAFFICGHNWFGIGIWKMNKGFCKAFIGEWPYGDDGDFSENHDFINTDINYWGRIGHWPTDYTH